MGRGMCLGLSGVEGGTLQGGGEAFAEKYHATPAQIALNRLINSQGDGGVTIPGVTQVSQAVESDGVMKFRLSGDELAWPDELN